MDMGDSAGSLEEALLRQLGDERCQSEWSEDELAFFESYIPEEPITDTFSDLFRTTP